jgi:hypothetical protein
MCTAGKSRPHYNGTTGAAREVAHLDALHDWLNSKAAQSSPIASIAHIDTLRDWLNSLVDDKAPAGEPFTFSLQLEGLPIAARP